MKTSVRSHLLLVSALSLLLAPLCLASDPEGSFKSARVVHNVTVNGEPGIRVHAQIAVKHGLGTPCRLIAYFAYDDAEDTPLLAADDRYSAVDGQVSLFVPFKPAYDSAVYKDLQLFVPYSALNMAPGDEYDLKFALMLYDESAERFFGESEWYSFTLSMP